MKKYVPFLMVCVGSISYGIPASLVKLSELEKNQLNILIMVMLLFSSIILTLFSNLFERKKGYDSRLEASKKSKMTLFVSGFSIFGTNYFYMNSLSYISVSVAAVLLMQSIWITSLLHFFFKKERPTKSLIIQTLLILIGTILATNIIQDHKLSFTGILLGIASAICYSFTLYFTGNSSEKISPINKAKLMIYGAFSLSLIALINTNNIFQNIFYISFFGGVIAIFSVFIPLLSFTLFMPKVSGGLGPLISSFELPSAIFFSYVLLGEEVDILQIIGILIIIFTISYSSINTVVRSEKTMS